MIEFIQKLFIGHCHKWKIIEQYNLLRKREDNTEVIRSIRKVLQCEICGKLKKFDI